MHIPWSAGSRETPKFDSMGTAYTKTETLGHGESRVDDSAGKEVAITDVSATLEFQLVLFLRVYSCIISFVHDESICRPYTMRASSSARAWTGRGKT